MILPKSSLKKLDTVKPILRDLIIKVAEISEIGFIVTEGIRTRERQLELFKARKSQTMNSRHLTGDAVDLAVWMDYDEDKVVGVNELSWKFPDYKLLADKVKEVSKEMGIAIIWGGDWRVLRDGPHFELDRKEYS